MTITSDATLAQTTDHPAENTLKLYDGSELFYRAWLPEAPASRAVFLFHRGHEHSGRFLDVVAALGLKNLAVFAWDARGHGRSPGERGYAPGFSTTVRDVDFFVRRVCDSHGIAIENSVVLGHSLGAVAVATWVHDYAPPIRAMVLVAPAFQVKLYVPLAIPGLRLLQKLKGAGKKSFIKSYVKASMLTHDAEHAAAYARDPLITRSIAVNVLLDLHDTSKRLLEDAAAIETPTLVLSAGAEWVVKNAAQRLFFERLTSPEKRMRTFSGMYHDLLHEKNREPVLAEVRDFIAAAFTRPAFPPPVNNDRQGLTKIEHDRLRAPAKGLVTRIHFAVQRLMLKTLGRLSTGIRLGWRTGFNSGPMLDYVYKNQPQGSLFLGSKIDRTFLNAIGWRGIRTRKAHIQEMLIHCISHEQGEGERVHVVDVAAGAGRCVIEVLQGLDRHGLTALMRDADAAALEIGRRHAEFHGVKHIDFEQGDAFDESALAALRPAPTIAIISGLFELFPENDRVLRTLRGLAAAMRGAGDRGGTLIYTGQPWHPQLEMIARVLTGSDRKPWAMRRRTQLELDWLVHSAGFTKRAMRIDSDGIFTVSCATIRGAS